MHQCRPRKGRGEGSSTASIRIARFIPRIQNPESKIRVSHPTNFCKDISRRVHLTDARFLAVLRIVPLRRESSSRRAWQPELTKLKFCRSACHSTCDLKSGQTLQESADEDLWPRLAGLSYVNGTRERGCCLEIAASAPKTTRRRPMILEAPARYLTELSSRNVALQMWQRVPSTSSGRTVVAFAFADARCCVELGGAVLCR